MRVEPTKQIARQQIDNTLRGESRQDFVNQEPNGAGEPGRAVVVVSPQVQEPTAPQYRPATFLAHLIATRDQAPQTRERRRVAPADAAAAYGAVARLARA